MIIRKAEKVMISIFSVEGGTLEIGEANNNSSVWSYRTGIHNPDFPGAKVLILATDSQGNQAELAVRFFDIVGKTSGYIVRMFYFVYMDKSD